MSRKIDFYCAWYCPFAQRTWIALEHLALTYNYRETDPYNKTERWLKLSRGTGQVPALRITAPLEDPLAIPDSLRTLEYLDERPSSASPLYPITERDRVDTRFWLDRQGNSIIAYFYRLLKAQSGSVIWQDFSGHISKQLFYMLHRIPLELRNQWLNVFSGGYKTPQYIQIWPASHHSLF